MGEEFCHVVVEAMMDEGVRFNVVGAKGLLSRASLSSSWRMLRADHFEIMRVPVSEVLLSHALVDFREGGMHFLERRLPDFAGA